MKTKTPNNDSEFDFNKGKTPQQIKNTLLERRGKVIPYSKKDKESFVKRFQDSL